MAMNKTEIKEMERLQTLLALRITDQIDPDVEPSKHYDQWAEGWSVFYSHIERTFTSSLAQRRGEKDGIGSRAIEPIYSTRVKALRAMRNRFEREFAQKLRQIDLEIAKAELEDQVDAAKALKSAPHPTAQAQAEAVSDE